MDVITNQFPHGCMNLLKNRLLRSLLLQCILLADTLFIRTHTAQRDQPQILEYKSKAKLTTMVYCNRSLKSVIREPSTWNAYYLSVIGMIQQAVEGSEQITLGWSRSMQIDVIQNLNRIVLCHKQIKCVFFPTQGLKNGVKGGYHWLKWIRGTYNRWRNWWCRYANWKSFWNLSQLSQPRISLHINPNNQEVEVIVDDSTEGSASEDDEFDDETDEDDTDDESQNNENVFENESEMNMKMNLIKYKWVCVVCISLILYFFFKK